MQRHSWREATDDGLRFYRASFHGETWTLQSQLKGAEKWTAHDPITREEWRTLRDILWRKYQRGRCPWKLVEKIDRLLEEPDEGDGGREGGS